MRILVADDDPTSLLLARMALQGLGHECATVTDGSQAWNAFGTFHPDVIISDWMMPGQTGLELCQSIRAEPDGGRVYVILVTSKGAHNQIIEGMKAGADDYLLKPLDPDELEASLIAASRVTALHRQLFDQRTEMEGLNEQLAALARIDPLTGLRNRRVLQEDFEILEARAARYAHTYAIAILDIDNFKSYNDTHGHQAGDEVLRTVSAQLLCEARAGDVVYRYGGEEFLCIFPDQSVSGGIRATERMRASIQRLGIAHAATSPGVVTLSAGVASLDREHIQPVHEVLKAADDALYRAKQHGRNRVESTPPEPELEMMSIQPESDLHITG
jgi:two-component system chemotaxis response regulator CheY